MSHLKEQKVIKHEKARDEKGELIKGKPYLKTQPEPARMVRFQRHVTDDPTYGVEAVEVDSEDAPNERVTNVDVSESTPASSARPVGGK